MAGSYSLDRLQAGSQTVTVPSIHKYNCNIRSTTIQKQFVKNFTVTYWLCQDRRWWRKMMMAKAGMLFQQTAKGLFIIIWNKETKGLIIIIVNKVTIFFCNNFVLHKILLLYFVIFYKSNVKFLKLLWYTTKWMILG